MMTSLELNEKTESLFTIEFDFGHFQTSCVSYKKIFFSSISDPEACELISALDSTRDRFCSVLSSPSPTEISEALAAYIPPLFYLLHSGTSA